MPYCPCTCPFLLPQRAPYSGFDAGPNQGGGGGYNGGTGGSSYGGGSYGGGTKRKWDGNGGGGGGYNGGGRGGRGLLLQLHGRNCMEQDSDKGLPADMLITQAEFWCCFSSNYLCCYARVVCIGWLSCLRQHLV